MNNSINYINKEGLKFFGRVNASISHELKNILAVISETAGLLDDLTELAKQGKDLKLSTLEDCNESIAEEIQRGFLTIKQMNRFAHSVDVPVEKINLLETLKTTIKLSKLLSFAITVQINEPDEELKPVLTCPFLMQNLIYQILCFTYESVGLDAEINISLNCKRSGGMHLIFANLPQVALADFPTQKIQEAADILDVNLDMKSPPGQLDIWIPYTSDKISALALEL